MHRQSLFEDKDLLQAPKNRKDILTVLGDTKDREYPLWRAGSDHEYTLCTAFFDLQAETVEVIFGNPKKGLENDMRGTQYPLRADRSEAQTSRQAASVETLILPSFEQSAW